MKGKADLMWLPVRITLLLVLGLLEVGCSNDSRTADFQSPPPISPLPAETVVPTVADPQSLVQDSPLPTVSPALTLVPDSVQLVILHTNDNWGETEPCG
jgi:hypothetical protein